MALASCFVVVAVSISKLDADIVVLVRYKHNVLIESIIEAGSLALGATEKKSVSALKKYDNKSSLLMMAVCRYAFHEGTAEDKRLLGLKGANLCEMFRFQCYIFKCLIF